MTLQERSDLVISFAEVLHANGQPTDDMLSAVSRLGKTLGLRDRIIPHWGDVQLRAADETGRLVSLGIAAPTGVNMDRVARAMGAIDDACAGRLGPPALLEMISVIAGAPPVPTSLFTLAAAAGAAALSVIFGAQHVAAVTLITASAAAGALLRRALAHYSTNPFLQPLCAALLAGIVGALAVRCQLSSSLRLVAVCPCMILVPGPHVLNSMMDLSVARINLGASRLAYAGLVILAISSGLLLGMGLFGVSLPVGPPGRWAPLWLDVIAAGVAVAAFSVFFSMPLSMLGWPVAVGMAAHALRWWTLAAGGGTAIGALVACVFVGLILTPVAHRHRMPFAAIGFASVVSMMPGVFLFRTASGLLQLSNGSNMTLELLGATIADCMIAVTVILAMSFGVIVPKIAIDHLIRARGRRAMSGEETSTSTSSRLPDRLLYSSSEDSVPNP